MPSESLDERRQRLLVLGGIASSVAGVICVRDFAIDRMVSAGMIGTGMLAFLGVALVAWRSRSAEVLDHCARLFIVICLAVILAVVTVTGQTRSAGMPYLLVGPLIAAFLLPWRDVLGFAGLTALCFLGVGLHETLNPLPHLYGEVFITRLVEHIGLFVLVVAIVLWMRRRTDQQARLLEEQAVGLEAARDQALEMATAKSRFLANMSHEIRTPLNAVVGMSDMLMRQELSSESQSTVHTIRQSSNALLLIVNDILDFSRLQSNNLSIEVAPFAPILVIEDVLDLFVHAAMESNLVLKSDLDATTPDFVLGDANRIRQVLVNLVGNAVKFTKTGSVEVRLILGDERLRYEVHDTGPGVSESQQQSLFEEFFQTRGPGESEAQGTGLGLAISRRLVELMKGEIGVRSQRGAGAMFWVELPLMVPEFVPPISSTPGHRFLGIGVPKLGRMARSIGAVWGDSIEDVADPSIVFTSDPSLQGFDGVPMVLVAPLGTPCPERFRSLLHTPVSTTRFRSAVEQVFPVQDPRLATLPPMGSLEVLVAEDNPVNQLVMRQLLGALGHRATFAEDGAIAVRLARERTFDLILMDVHMPSLDGVGATRALRAAGTTTPIVALTASVLPEQRTLCLEAGMNDFLPKPVQLRILQEMILRHLGGV